MNSKNEIILYQSDDLPERIEVRVDETTVWLNQEQLTELFQRDQSVISRHIHNIFKESELEEKSTMQKMHIPNSDKPVAFYNLDVIISVGYRVKSRQGTQFRIWATNVLRNYMLKGYVLNDDTVLSLLAKRSKNTSCTIYTNRVSKGLKIDIEKHNSQYPPISIKEFKESHDRFLIIDYQELYHIGASLKDLGKKWFGFSRMDSLCEEVLNKLKEGKN